MSLELKTRKELIKQCATFAGQIRAQWREGTNLTIDLFNYFLYATEHRHDASLIGKLYNDLKDEHKPIAQALKKSAYDCCGIRFKADKKNEGRSIAYKDDKVWDGIKLGDATDEMQAAMLKLSSQDGKGLKEWHETKKAKDTSGGKKHSRVFGEMELIDKALLQLEEKPEAQEFVTTVRQRLMTIVNEVNSKLPEYGLGALVASYLKAEARELEKEEKEKQRQVA